MPFIALDLGGTNIKFGLAEHGRLLRTAHLTVPSHARFAALLPLIERQIDELLAQEGGNAPQGIGMAFPTLVDSIQMRLLYQYVKYPDAGDLDLAHWAKAKWGAPLALENDARAALVGEWQYGAGAGADNLVMATIGTGIGSAALINGQLLKGSHFLAGNLGGHMSIRFDGPRCNCGNTGCVESIASSWALPELIRRHSRYAESPFARGEKPDYEAVFRLAAQGDPLALDIREHSLEAWAAGILNLIYAYDPERLILGGGVMHSAEVILPFFRQKIRQAAWLPENAVEIVPAAQPDWAGVLGMAYLAAQNIANQHN